MTTLAGLAGNPGAIDGTSSARHVLTRRTVVDSTGSVYVADWLNDAIRKLTPHGTNWVVTTLAGLGGHYGNADAGIGTVARFGGPAGVAIDSVANFAGGPLTMRFAR
ncbi:MAG: hypothetical protein U1G07_05805 [Verrucomicrobiota bacterium]